MARTLQTPPSSDPFVIEKREGVMRAARDSGFLGEGREQIGARVPKALLAAAKARAGVTSTTEVIEYALAKVAVEDDFWPKFLARRGSVSRDVDLEF